MSAPNLATSSSPASSAQWSRVFDANHTAFGVWAFLGWPGALAWARVARSWRQRLCPVPLIDPERAQRAALRLLGIAPAAAAPCASGSRKKRRRVSEEAAARRKRQRRAAAWALCEQAREHCAQLSAESRVASAASVRFCFAAWLREVQLCPRQLPSQPCDYEPALRSIFALCGEEPRHVSLCQGEGHAECAEQEFLLQKVLKRLGLLPLLTRRAGFVADFTEVDEKSRECRVILLDLVRADLKDFERLWHLPARCNYDDWSYFFFEHFHQVVLHLEIPTDVPEEPDEVAITRFKRLFHGRLRRSFYCRCDCLTIRAMFSDTSCSSQQRGMRLLALFLDLMTEYFIYNVKQLELEVFGLVVAHGPEAPLIRLENLHAAFVHLKRVQLNTESIAVQLPVRGASGSKDAISVQLFDAEESARRAEKAVQDSLRGRLGGGPASEHWKPFPTPHVPASTERSMVVRPDPRFW